ncbi:hypothetical protein Efla_001931 [Eimeria flavescens]
MLAQGSVHFEAAAAGTSTHCLKPAHPVTWRRQMESRFEWRKEGLSMGALLLVLLPSAFPDSLTSVVALAECCKDGQPTPAVPLFQNDPQESEGGVASDNLQVLTPGVPLHALRRRPRWGSVGTYSLVLLAAAVLTFLVLRCVRALTAQSREYESRFLSENGQSGASGCDALGDDDKDASGEVGEGEAAFGEDSGAGGPSGGIAWSRLPQAELLRLQRVLYDSTGLIRRCTSLLRNLAVRFAGRFSAMVASLFLQEVSVVDSLIREEHRHLLEPFYQALFGLLRTASERLNLSTEASATRTREHLQRALQLAIEIRNNSFVIPAPESSRQTRLGRSLRIWHALSYWVRQAVDSTKAAAVKGMVPADAADKLCLNIWKSAKLRRNRILHCPIAGFRLSYYLSSIENGSSCSEAPLPSPGPFILPIPELEISELSDLWSSILPHAMPPDVISSSQEAGEAYVSVQEEFRDGDLGAALPGLFFEVDAGGDDGAGLLQQPGWADPSFQPEMTFSPGPAYQQSYGGTDGQYTSEGAGAISASGEDFAPAQPEASGPGLPGVVYESDRVTYQQTHGIQENSGDPELAPLFEPRSGFLEEQDLAIEEEQYLTEAGMAAFAPEILYLQEGFVVVQHPVGPFDSDDHFPGPSSVGSWYPRWSSADQDEDKQHAQQDQADALGAGDWGSGSPGWSQASSLAPHSAEADQDAAPPPALGLRQAVVPPHSPGAGQSFVPPLSSSPPALGQSVAPPYPSSHPPGFGQIGVPSHFPHPSNSMLFPPHHPGIGQSVAPPQPAQPVFCQATGSQSVSGPAASGSQEEEASGSEATEALLQPLANWANGGAGGLQYFLRSTEEDPDKDEN